LTTQCQGTMGSSKKYKLFSASKAAPGETPICAFFSSPAGCRNGDNCKFLHEQGGGKVGSGGKKKQDATVEISETSSVVSSESEGGAPNPVVKNVSYDPFADSVPPQQNTVKQGKDQKPKKKKRKSSDGDMFAGPKNKAAKVISSSTNMRQETPSKKSKKAASGVKHIEAASSAPDFRSFVSNLPVASFSIPDSKTPPVQKDKEPSPDDGVSSASKSKPSTSKMEGQLRGRILPKSTAVGRKWQNAVIKSRQHERYDTSYDFARYKDNDSMNGIQGDWIKAKPFGDWCQSYPQAIAIDCEMCETQDPLSGAKNTKALCRLSVVNAENPEEVLIDTLVKPSWPVTDYRTRINGVAKEHLDSVEFTLRHAQAFMMALCSEETVIVGHAVHNDLVALNMEHDVVADSSFLFRGKESPSSPVSLKDTVMSVMNESMPETHDSVNDARKALACVVHWMEKNGKVDLVDRTPKHSNHKGHQLFVHRIPKLCKPEHLSNMFLKNTSIQPVEVEEIQFSGTTGKTHVIFKSSRHANLAFEALDGKAEEEKSGRLQKKVFLRNGDYVRVRKMVHAKHADARNSTSPESAKKHPFAYGNDGQDEMAPCDKQESGPPLGSFRAMEFSKPSWME